MEDKKHSSPLPSLELIKNENSASLQEIYAYQQRIGSINFAAVTTRPDIAFAASKLSEFLINPSSDHLRAATHVLEYLKNTRTLSIEYNGNTPLRTVFLSASDASYADVKDSRHSSQGYVFKLFGGPIDWKATKQRTVTLSTTEAELLALTTTAKETIWWSRFFQSIDFDPGHVVRIECDNRQTLSLLEADSPRINTKLRHVDIHQHWLRQEVQNHRIQVQWVPTGLALADGFTKSLSTQKHAHFVSLLGLVELDSHPA